MNTRKIIMAPSGLENFSRDLVYLCLFLIPFYFWRFSYSFIKTNVFEIAIGCALVIFLWLRISSKNKDSIKFGSLWAILFVLSAAAAIFYSGIDFKGLGLLKGYFVVPYLLYFLIINQFDYRDIKKLALPVFAGAIIVVGWGVLQYLGVKHFFPNQNDADLQNYLNDPRPRIFSFFESPNYLAMYLAPIIFISLLLTKEKQINWRNVVIALAAAAFFITLYLTGSRGGLIGFLVGVVFLVVKRMLQTKSLSNYIIIAFLIFTTANFAYDIIKFNHPNSQIGREKIFNYSMQMVKEHPVFGAGLGDYQQFIAKEAENDQEFLDYFLPYAYHPHNLYLDIWFNLGIIGVLAFLVFIAKVFFNLSGNLSLMTNLLIIGALLAILVHGIIDTTYFKNDLAAIFWFLCALAFMLRDPSTKSIYGGKLIL